MSDPPKIVVADANMPTPALYRQIRFVSSNPGKIAEAKAILGPHGIAVVPIALKIEELQTANTKLLLHDKLLRAFQQVGRPLFVEHTGLYVEHVGGLPGGLTQIFWDALQAEAFAALFGRDSAPTVVIARTWISYCDGRQITDWEGTMCGTIVSPPRGPRDFQWDCVFQPEGTLETLAEMGPRKNDVSMRRRALDKLAGHLAGAGTYA